MKANSLFTLEFLYLLTRTTEVSVLDTTKTKYRSVKFIDNLEEYATSEIIEMVSILPIEN